MISVIIPVYNVKPYIAQCLDSVIRQSHREIEIIIVDDGSTDGSGAICDTYVQRDARIRVIHQENRGLSAARNRGIEAAHGEFLSFVDSDDYLLCDMLEQLLSACRKQDADMAICTHRILDERRNPPLLAYSQPPCADCEVFNGPEIMDAYLRQRKIANTVWARLYKASLFDEIRFPVGRFYEDVFTTYKLLHASKRLVLLGKPGYIYRNARPGSITTRMYIPRHMDILYGRLEELEFIRKHYPHLVACMESNLISGCTGLTHKLVVSNIHDPNAEALIQTLFKRHLRSHIRNSKSIRSIVFSILAGINLRFAMLAMRCYIKLRGK